MLWKGRRQSTNVDDRRGLSGGGIVAGGGIVGLIILVLNFFLGDGDLSQLQQTTNTPMSAEQTATDNERAEFVKVVLAETEDVWHKLMQDQGYNYPEPTLVLFRNSVESGCGGASAAVGPFYCPADEKLYIDLSFFEDLQTKLNSPGDFPMAYVIAHEVGHHIQKITGIADKMDALRQHADEHEINRFSVKMELQADFYAGIWAHYAERTHNILEDGDIEEALNAANSIGDDRLQRRSQGYVVPDAFTHGTSAQRVYWFKKGYETGDLSQGDTFNDPSL
jgi:predicted metalloprotease